MISSNGETEIMVPVYSLTALENIAMEMTRLIRRCEELGDEPAVS